MAVKELVTALYLPASSFASINFTLCSMWLFTVYLGNGGFPAEETALLPLALKHLFDLRAQLFEVEQGLGPLDEVFQVLD